MMRKLIALSLMLCFAGAANATSYEFNRRDDRRPPSQGDRIAKVGEVRLSPYYQWHQVNVYSCSRYRVDGDQIQLRYLFGNNADVDAVEVEFGDGRRGRQRIAINKRQFSPNRPNTAWKNLRGNKAYDRCISRVWVYGKTINSSWRGSSVLGIYLKDLKGPGRN